MPRATPLPADERRAAIMAATEPLVERYGREVSTRQIAEAAGIAEGTIFRVFTSKDALIDAVVEDAIDVETTCAELHRLSDADLEVRLTGAVAILQRRLRRMMTLFHALRLQGPPPDDARRRQQEHNERLTCALAALIEPDHDRLRVSPVEAARTLRSLTIAGSHPHITDRLLEPAEIVAILLYGLTARAKSPVPTQEPAC